MVGNLLEELCSLMVKLVTLSSTGMTTLSLIEVLCLNFRTLTGGVVLTDSWKHSSPYIVFIVSQFYKNKLYVHGMVLTMTTRSSTHASLLNMPSINSK